MSIASAVNADLANKKVDEWVRRLMRAYDMRDWGLVREAIGAMQKNRFVE